MRLSVVTESAELAVTLSEVKSWLKIDHNEDDDKLYELIKSATVTIESFINQAIITKTFLYVVDNTVIDDNYDIAIYLPYIPISISFVRVCDTENTANTITTYEKYSRKIIFTDLNVTPRTNEAYQVQFTAGIASNATSTPRDIKIVLKEVVAFFYDNCCDKTLSDILKNLSHYINFEQISVY
jgi:uncharacterized phiE125 gp8 family phage protein